MKVLRLDFETRSLAELSGKNSVGLHNYMTHPSTLVLMLGYKLPSASEVLLWQPVLGERMPEDLREAILNPTIRISAFNSAFERYALKYKLDLDIHPSRFLDPQVSARYLSIPASLEEAGDILDLPSNLMKDKRGEALIDLFSIPQKRKKRGQPVEYFFYDWTTHPKEWAEFGEYCKQDVVTEEELSRRLFMLQALPLPLFEQKLWVFDQIVNDRGMPVDVSFVKKAYALALRSKAEALEKQNALTGLENSNSTTQLLPWVKARGYPHNTLRKETVDSTLKDPDVILTPECRQVLIARREASSTSYTKLAAILRQVSSDGRLRNQFIFMGSSRCGRWSGNAVQLHNMARPDGTFEKRKNLEDARALIHAEDYEGIKKRFETKDTKTGQVKPGSVLLVIKNVIRTVFVANAVAA